MGILNKVTAGLSVAVLSLGVSGGAFAGVAFGDGGAGLQAVLDGITDGGPSSVNVATDESSPDAYWSIGAAGGSVSTIVVEIAGFAGTNTFGIYDKAGDTYYELFDGAATTGAKVTIGIDNFGNVYRNFVDTGVDFTDNLFAFYLDSTAGGPGGGVFFSDTSLNSDGVDHMAAYEGGNGDILTIGAFSGEWFANEYILAWEDLMDGGDGDFRDFVVIVESVAPQNVPEPAVLGFLGFGLLGMGIAARRRRVA